MSASFVLEVLKSAASKLDACRRLGLPENNSGYRKLAFIADRLGFEFKKERAPRYCLYCGKELVRGQFKFCSRAHTGMYNRSASILSGECAVCGRPTPYGRKFCSNECWGLHRRRSHYESYLKNQESYCCADGNKSMHFVKPFILQEQNNRCILCGCSPIHNGKPLVFVLDHIDGDSGNNLRSNLRLVCPNCDSQLPTFKSRNMKSARREHIRALYNLRKMRCE